MRVLRAAFAGIGQLLLIADRRRGDRQPPAGRPDAAAGQSGDSARQTGPATAPAQAEELIPQPRSHQDPASQPASVHVPATKAQLPATVQAAEAEPAASARPTATTAQPAASARPTGTTTQPAANPPVPTITVPRPASPPSAAPSRPAAGRAARAQRAAAAQPPGRVSDRDRWRSLDQTGNVRLIAPGEADDDQQAATAGPGVAGAATAGATAASASPGPGTRSPAAAPPVAGYESWSVPSLRARLRTLNAAQVEALADYERATARRAEVLTMFERRLAKLADGQ